MSNRMRRWKNSGLGRGEKLVLDNKGDVAEGLLLLGGKCTECPSRLTARWAGGFGEIRRLLKATYSIVARLPGLHQPDAAMGHALMKQALTNPVYNRPALFEASNDPDKA